MLHWLKDKKKKVPFYWLHYYKNRTGILYRGGKNHPSNPIKKIEINTIIIINKDTFHFLLPCVWYNTLPIYTISSHLICHNIANTIYPPPCYNFKTLLPLLIIYYPSHFICLPQRRWYWYKLCTQPTLICSDLPQYTIFIDISWYSHSNFSGTQNH